MIQIFSLKTKGIFWWARWGQTGGCSTTCEELSSLSGHHRETPQAALEGEGGKVTTNYEVKDEAALALVEMMNINSTLKVLLLESEPPHLSTGYLGWCGHMFRLLEVQC